MTESFPEDLRRFGWAENIAPHADTIYINVAKGILRWRGGQMSPLPVAQRDLIHVLHGDTGQHHAYVQNGPLFRIEGDAAVRISDDPRLTRSQLRFCARTADGALLVVQSSGDIWTLRGDRVQQ